MAGETPVEELIFALAGEDAGLAAAFKKAEAGADHTGAAIQTKLGAGFKGATDSAKQHASQIDNLRAKYDTAFASQQKLVQTEKDLAKLVAAGVISHQQAIGVLKNVGDAGKAAGEGIAVSRREFIYAGREIATGDFQRMPATLALLASHMLELSGAAIATGIAIVAPFVALTAAIYKSQEAITKLKASVALTGSASGINYASAFGIASSLATPNRQGVFANSEIVSQLLGGLVPGNQISAAAQAASAYSLGAGVENKEASATVSKIFSDPTKSAEELNNTMRLLTAEQTEEVNRLARQGQTEEAGTIILKAFNDRAQEAANAASGFAVAIRNAKIAGQNLAHSAARAAGVEFTPQDKIDDLERERHRVLNAYPAGSSTQNRYLANIDQQENDIRAAALKDFQDKYAKGQASQQNVDITEGLKSSDTGAGKFDKALLDLASDVTKANNAVRQAQLLYGPKPTLTQQNQIDRLQAEATAKATVAANQLSPLDKAYIDLQNRKDLSQASLEQFPKVQQHQENLSKLREDLANPETANDALKIFQVREEALKYNPEEARKAAEQRQNLDVMKEQADASEKIAAAYDVSTSAAERARIEGEVAIQVKHRQIAASAEHTAVLYKEAQAYADADAQLSRSIVTQNRSNAGLVGVVAAGGDPFKVAQARAQARAEEQVADQEERAFGDPIELARVQDKKNQLTAGYIAADQANAQISGNSSLYGRQNSLRNLQQNAAAFSAGISDDDLRRLQVYQSTLDEVNKLGLDPQSEAYKKLLKDMTDTNVEISDLSDNFQKAQKEAKGLADDITGGLASWLKNPSQNPFDALAGIGQNLLGTVVQSSILDPMNKWLTSQFGNLLGVGQLGSSPANAMWVQSIGGLAPGAGPSGIPGAGGLFSGLTGDTGLFGANGWLASLLGTGGSTIMDTADLLPLVGLASGGRSKGGQWYQVNEIGQEFWSADSDGTVYPVGSPVPVGQRDGGGDGGGSATTNHYHQNNTFNLPNVTDTRSFVRSTGQLKAALARSAQEGRRGM